VDRRNGGPGVLRVDLGDGRPAVDVVVNAGVVGSGRVEVDVLNGVEVLVGAGDVVVEVLVLVGDGVEVLVGVGDVVVEVLVLIGDGVEVLVGVGAVVVEVLALVVGVVVGVILGVAGVSPVADVDVILENAEEPVGLTIVFGDIVIVGGDGEDNGDSEVDELCKPETLAVAV